MLPTKLQELVSRNLKSHGQYSHEVRSFALALHFYSPKAYSYVRRCFKKLLPNPSTLRAWYKVVDGKPGFTEEAIQAIKLRTKNTKILCNLVIDEMAIRQQIVYNNGQFYGCVDLGMVSENKYEDNMILAKNALVIMVVALNEHWKIPIGYFLIQSLSGYERAKLRRRALEMIHDTGVVVQSITFDGASSNITMCTHLGANLVYDSNFKPWFAHPVTCQPVYIFYDLCHMFKLVRNTLGDKNVLYANNEYISWDFVKQLYTFQQNEGLHAANKLTAKHIDYNENRMNVRLAVQTLSKSVYNSLKFLYDSQDIHTKKIFKNLLNIQQLY